MEKFPNALKCEKCPSLLKTKRVYRLHLRERHENRQKYQCDFCGSEFADKKSIKRHFVAKHLK
jgi:transposase-like protein